MVSRRIRTFNRYVTNRLLRGFAHRSHGPFAVLGHVGRRSGKPYETTIMVWQLGEGFVIALTYGPEVDWYRNLLVAGGGTLRWHGRSYVLGRPEPMEAQRALAAFPALLRLILRRVGVRQFVWMKATPSLSALRQGVAPPADVQ